VTTPDILTAIAPVIDAFERLSVPYSVAGSVASSAHGVARSTLDIHLVADLRDQHVRTTSTATPHGTRCAGGRPFDQESFRSRSDAMLEEQAGARGYAMDSPEDTILHKLEWYRAGGEVSERQWNDVIGVVEIQGSALDLDYLRRWAARLGVLDLLERAFSASRRTR
jgi:hypothetical protein